MMLMPSGDCIMSYVLLFFPINPPPAVSREILWAKCCIVEESVIQTPSGFDFLVDVLKIY